MDYSLTPEDRRYVEDQVKAGRFRSATDVLANALSMLRGQEFSPEHEQYLRRELQVGIDQIERGEVEDWDVHRVRGRLRDQLRDNG